ncbi:MAG: aldo/keto reductase [Puniceicoccaceae bacterium]|nr:MAG: aldo/keto reductase [Puniceicoccaceae bacterium]
METTLFGKTGRTVSRLGFGGAPAGIPDYLRPRDPDAPGHREAVLAALRRAAELGITFFDTAAAYGEGRSERLFGEGLAGIPADRLFLATKVQAKQNRPVRASLESSLRHLRRDAVDLLQLHGTAYTAEEVRLALRPGGLLDQMEALRSEGLVRHLGFTAECLNRPFFDLLDSGRFESVQLLYNFCNQQPCDFSWQSGALFEAEARGLGIAAMRSATSGLLQRWIQRVNPANSFDYTPALLQFQFSNPFLDVVIVGMDHPDIVEKNVALCADTAGRIDLPSLHQRRPPDP